MNLFFYIAIGIILLVIIFLLKKKKTRMEKPKGKTGTTATVSFKVIDKDGNVKQQGTLKGSVVPQKNK